MTSNGFRWAPRTLLDPSGGGLNHISYEASSEYPRVLQLATPLEPSRLGGDLTGLDIFLPGIVFARPSKRLDVQVPPRDFFVTLNSEGPQILPSADIRPLHLRFA
jgi:hypothetical protein